jgi:3-oxoacyl-[acyl-carrier-protein] synthase-1
MAKKQCRDVAYINLHGTGTTHNDSMESRLIARMGFECAVSSTKALTGHSLGAAGAIEAALSCLTLDSDGYLPPHVWDEVQDPALPQLNLSSRLPNSPKVVMSNNFAFGGNNTSLILERV